MANFHRNNPLTRTWTRMQKLKQNKTGLIQFFWTITDYDR